MKLEGNYLFEASVAEVWSALFDPVILAAVMPGCEKLDLVDGQYVGEIKVKVGPIQGKFTGKVDLKDKVEPESYTMIVDGRGAPGFVKATAAVKLVAEGESTRVFYDTDAQVGGKIASVGQRLLEASARAIVAQSLEGLHTNIKLRAAAYREAAASKGGETASQIAGAASQSVEAVSQSAEATSNDAEAASNDAEAASKGVESATNGVGAATNGALAASKSAELTSTGAEAAGKLTEAAGKTAVATEAVGKATEAVGKATEATEKATEAVSKAIEAASKAAEAASKSTEVASKAAEAASKATEVAEAASKPTEAAGKPAQAAGTSSDAGTSAGAVAFTPVKVKQSDLANAVAKEVASSLFPRSVLVAIILIQALVIVWLLVRH